MIVPKKSPFHLKKIKYIAWDTVCLKLASGLFFDSLLECKNYCNKLNKEKKYVHSEE